MRFAAAAETLPFRRSTSLTPVLKVFQLLQFQTVEKRGHGMVDGLGLMMSMDM